MSVYRDSVITDFLNLKTGWNQVMEIIGHNTPVKVTGVPVVDKSVCTVSQLINMANAFAAGEITAEHMHQWVNLVWFNDDIIEWQPMTGAQEEAFTELLNYLDGEEDSIMQFDIEGLKMRIDQLKKLECDTSCG